MALQTTPSPYGVEGAGLVLFATTPQGWCRVVQGCRVEPEEEPAEPLPAARLRGICHASRSWHDLRTVRRGRRHRGRSCWPADTVAFGPALRDSRETPRRS